MKELNIQSTRLFFRRMSPDDFHALASMLQNPRVNYAWEQQFSDEDVRNWIKRNCQFYTEFGYAYWLACDRNSGETVGQIGLIPETVEGCSHIGIGWMLREEFQHRGYALEGAGACLDYAFQTLKAGRVIADIRPCNTTSIKVAERLSMIPSGQYNKIVNGKIMSHLIYYKRTPLITVADYNSLWQERFEKLRILLNPLLKEFKGSLEHIGSSSVPGMAAKPIIDADFILPDWTVWQDLKKELEFIGFHHQGDGNLPGREMFTESLHLDFRHNFYVCRTESPHLRNHLILRDYLRSHAEEAKRYSDLKKQLALRFPHDIASYCAGKSDLLSELLASAGLESSLIAQINQINKPPRQLTPPVPEIGFPVR